MTRAGALTDEMWARIEPLLPGRTPRRGGRWAQRRPVTAAICWRFWTASPWRDLPSDCCAWRTVWWRFDRWAKAGTWERVVGGVQGQANAGADLEWVVWFDSSVARAQQRA